MINTTFNIPALLAESPSANVSANYHFLSTKDIVDTLGDHGWHPREAFYMQSRKADDPERDPLHAKHCIRFNNPECTKENSAEFPEIVMYNAHNGTSRLNFLSGIFRLVCSNGHVIMSDEFAEMGVQHRGPMANMDYVSFMIQTITDRTNDIVNKISRFGNMELNSEQKQEYYTGAMKLRFPDAVSGESWIFDMPQRREDRGNDMWRVLNRTQEYLLNGGFMATHTSGKKAKMARSLSNIDRTKRLNTDLWQYSEKFYDYAIA